MGYWRSSQVSGYGVLIVAFTGLSHTTHASEPEDKEAPPPATPASPSTQQATTEELPYTEGPVPAGYHVENRIKWGYVTAGGFVFGMSYGISFAMGASVTSECEPDPGETDRTKCAFVDQMSPWLMVPVFGPLITISECNHPPCGESPGLLYVDALIQGIGASLLIYGLASPDRVLVRDTGSPQAFVTPVVGQHAWGLALTGRM